MAKFFGEIGFSSDQVETSPGSWDDTIVKRNYRGDVIRNAQRVKETESVNDDLTLNMSISIIADPYANEHFFAIRYIKYAGTLWKVTEVEKQSPRLILRLGGVYHGPTS